MFNYGENYTRTTYNNEEVPEDFKGNTSIENDDQKGSIDETDDQPNTEEDEDVLDNNVEQTVDIEGFVYVGANYILKEGNVDGKHDETLEVMYEGFADALEVSEDDCAIIEENEIYGAKVKNDDGYQSQKSEAIKMLFKATFSENSKEMVENIFF